MNKDILNTGVQEYILKNLNTDIMSVILQKQQFKNVSQKELAEQIEAKNKCKKKLPTWYTTPNIYYPNKLNIEQTSSEATAKYKTAIISGNTLIDVTGGFGVDCFYFAQKFSNVTHVELNSELSTIVQHNYNVFTKNNITTIAGDGINYLEQLTSKVDCIYIDPSRRDDLKRKVFLLSDCQPNIIEKQAILFNYTNTILVKTAPLLDIPNGISTLKNVAEIHIVGVQNEVKEILWVLKKDHCEKPIIKTININQTGNEVFSFSPDDEKNAISEFAMPQTYVYEPNTVLLKAGAFKLIGKHYGLHKLHQHTHLYTHSGLIEFPGRRFNIKNTIKYAKKTLKSFENSKCNVTTKNFPITVANLRAKHKLKDGGNTYLFFIKNMKDELVVLVCEKV